MASEYANVYLEFEGKAYRVAFHVATERPMCVALRPRAKTTDGRERFLHIDKARAARVVKEALPLLKLKKGGEPHGN